MSLSEKLKAETAALHQQLEEQMYSAEIMIGSLTIQQYKEMLEILYGIIEPFEDEWAIIADTNEPVKDLWQNRWKTSLLQNDLLHLGEENFKIEKYIFNNWDYYKLLGAAYVIEGSTLGGKLISKKLMDNASIPNNIMDYFTQCDDEAGKLWKDFIHFLNGHEEKHSEVIEGAKNTFKMFINKTEKIRSN